MSASYVCVHTLSACTYVHTCVCFTHAAYVHVRVIIFICMHICVLMHNCMRMCTCVCVFDIQLYT